MLSILFSRKKEENDELYAQSITVQAIQAVEADLKKETAKEAEPVSITQRHRTAIEKGIRNVEERLFLNHEEMERLTNEYNLIMSKIRSDNAEYELSLRAMNASIAIFDENVKKGVDDLLERAFLSQGLRLKDLQAMWSQSLVDNPTDPYAAFADHLGWSREDAENLAFRLSYEVTIDEKKEEVEENAPAS